MVAPGTMVPRHATSRTYACLPMTEQASPAASAAISLSGQILGRFIIGERLGKGGMGEVYRAEDTRLKRAVAIKRLSPYLRSDPLYRRRFQEEAERASRFTDPHVAAIYDVIDEQGETLLVMEFVEGQTLRRRLHEPMSLDEFLRIAIECAEALVAADHVGIVHCDIKPENIMLSTSGMVKILDFGVAKFLPRSDQSSTVDRSGTIGGTPAYMSPEVLLEKGADGRSDVFSLGLVLYEALAGHHPFLSDSYVATTHRILREKAASIRIFNATVPEELDRIVGRMMAKDPADRYANAQDVAEDLRAVQAGITPSKLLPHPLIRYQHGSRSWIAAVMGVVLVLGAAYGYYMWKHRPPPFQERGWALITDFDSTGEDPIPDKGVREGLTIALQQSPYVNVYPRSRIYEALQRMKRSDVSRIDETLGREICRRENIQVLLTGSIEHLGQAFQITVRGESAATGSLLFAEKEDFSRKEQFFDGVDRLARNVRQDLGESIAKIAKTTKPLANVTTSSLDALQLYSEASDYMVLGKLDPVPSLLQGALQLDPNFAMAHLQLGRYYSWLVGKTEAASVEFGRAYQLRDSVSDRERRRIEAHYYEDQERYDDAAHALEILVSLYPDDVEAHDVLAAAYYNAGKVDQGISELEKVLVLDPTSAPAYRKLVLYLARSSRAQEAIATFEKARQLGIASPEVHWAAGLAFLGQGDVLHARDEFRKVGTNSVTDRELQALYLTIVDLYEGKLQSAQTELHKQIQAAQPDEGGLQLQRRYLLGRTSLLLGREEEAKVEADKILGGSGLQTSDLQQAGTLYARAGRLNDAKQALRRLDRTRKAVPSSWNASKFYNLQGEIWLAQHKPTQAERSFLEAAKEYPQSFTYIGLSRACQLQKNWNLAIQNWQKVLSMRGEILQNDFPPDLALAYVESARAYSERQDPNDAAKQYREALRMWQNAEGFPLLVQVRRESQEMILEGKP